MPAPETRESPRWSSLAREITIILVAKAVALCLIWLAFFSQSSGRHLEAAGVAKSLLNAPDGQPQPQESERAPRPGSR
jgi:hypothetical protein